MFSCLIVGLGGALGSILRFWIPGMVTQRYAETFPARTLLVNVTGSLVIRFFAAPWIRS